jgi:glucose/arabinose dehydrogenase
MLQRSLLRLFMSCILIASLIMVPTAKPSLAAGPMTVPAGFVDELVVGGLFVAYTWAWAPDGRIIIGERGSAVTNDENWASIRVFKNGALLPTRAVSFPVQGNGERGLLGIAIDPNFTTNGYLYTYYTRQASPTSCNGVTLGSGQACNRVSRWTMVGDTINPNTEKVLIDNILNISGVHNGGDIGFGSDGNLYITTGEGGEQPLSSRNPARLAGKVLRIRPDASGYTIPSDNPYRTAANARQCGLLPMPGGSGPCQEVYAIGFRNPFRMTIKPGTSTPYIFDVGGGGSSGWEEINEIRNNGDYGYNDIEGFCPNTQNCSGTNGIYTDPIFAYSHTNTPHVSGGAAIVGGAFYVGSSYPAEYANNLFYADFINGWIRRLAPAANNSWTDHPFASNGTGIIGMEHGSDTNIYYLTGAGEIRRIRYEAGVNQPPTARLQASPTSGPLATTFTFTGSGSTDPESSALSYIWDFGDGTSPITTTTSVVTRTYSLAGAYTVSLQVRDSGSPPTLSELVSTRVFSGNEPATGEIIVTNLTNAGRTKYYAGDSWSFSAANLSDDQTPAQDIQVQWEVRFHHREHSHPFVGQFSGTSGSITIPASGEYDYVVWYRVIMSLTDAQGQTVTIERDILPEVTTITLSSNIGSIELNADAVPLMTTSTISRVVGFQSGITAPASVVLNTKLYTFIGWSDGAASSARVIQVPAAGGSYEVRYAYLPGRVMLPVVQRAFVP